MCKDGKNFDLRSHVTRWSAVILLCDVSSFLRQLSLKCRQVFSFFFRVPQSVFACLCTFAAERLKIAAVFYAHENQSVPAALCHTLCWCTEHQTIDSVRPKSQSLMFKLRSRTTFKLWNRDKRRGQMETHGRMQYTPTCQKTSENYQSGSDWKEPKVRSEG